MFLQNPLMAASLQEHKTICLARGCADLPFAKSSGTFFNILEQENTTCFLRAKQDCRCFSLIGLQLVVPTTIPREEQLLQCK